MNVKILLVQVMGCFRRLLGISYRDHVTNEKVRNRIRQAIGPYEDLLTTVKKRKLRWYGHKTRSTGLAKMILQGTVQGGRRRGRQKKRWEDNITEWTGLKLGEALRKAEDREEWRTVIARSSLVPQRSNRLWDKWSEVKMGCMCAQTRPRFILPSKEFFGNGVRTPVNSNGEFPSTGKLHGGSNTWCCITQDSKLNTLLPELLGPLAMIVASRVPSDLEILRVVWPFDRKFSGSFLIFNSQEKRKELYVLHRRTEN